MKIQITFSAQNYLPEDLRETISALAAQRLVQTFGNESGVIAALQAHNRQPQPDDPIQKALDAVEIDVARVVEPAYGASLARKLHPWIQLTPDN